VITVGTAPIDAKQREGEGRERRGGFQISPLYHNSRTEEAWAPMVLIVGQPGKERVRDLEGQPPLFRDAVGLFADLNDKNNAIVDVRIDDGPAWEADAHPRRPASGLLYRTGPDQGLAATGHSANGQKGRHAFSLRLPTLNPADAERVAVAAAAAYKQTRLAAARAGQVPIAQGQININAAPTSSQNVAYVRVSVEGVPRGITNREPFTFTWDTTSVPDGEYLIEAEALDQAGTLITATRRRVFVLNNVARNRSSPRCQGRQRQRGRQHPIIARRLKPRATKHQASCGGCGPWRTACRESGKQTAAKSGSLRRRLGALVARGFSRRAKRRASTGRSERYTEGMSTSPSSSSSLRREKSEALFAEAQQVIPGGVNSPVRAFKSGGRRPIFIERGEGPYLFDVDGKSVSGFCRLVGAADLRPRRAEHLGGHRRGDGEGHDLWGEHGARGAIRRGDHRGRCRASKKSGWSIRVPKRR
jgi:hypothetical protein